jgi:hypothetical protein
MIRKARKLHVCGICGGEIPPGVRYMDRLINADVHVVLPGGVHAIVCSAPSHQRECQRCAESGGLLFPPPSEGGTPGV